jgi:hypothetical protein
MKYDASTVNILVSRRFPQHVDSKECIETPRELEHNIQACAASLGIEGDMHEWVLAKNDTNDVDPPLLLNKMVSLLHNSQQSNFTVRRK